MVYSLASEMRVNGRAKIGLDFIKGDGDDRLVEVVDDTRDGGLYFGHGRALVSGCPVKTEHMPKQLKARTKGVIADYKQFHSFTIVSPAFREIIESFEPGVHQFLPMQIVGVRKAVLAEMFFMVVCNRLDSVDREHTTLLLYNGGIWSPGREVPREQWPPNFDPNVKGKFVFNREQIGEHHLWFDKHSGHGPYLSDTLAEALMEARMTGMQLRHWEEV